MSKQFKFVNPSIPLKLIIIVNKSAWNYIVIIFKIGYPQKVYPEKVKFNNWVDNGIWDHVLLPLLDAFPGYFTWGVLSYPLIRLNLNKLILIRPNPLISP